VARKKRSKPSFEPSPDPAEEPEAAWVHRSDAEGAEVKHEPVLPPALVTTSVVAAPAVAAPAAAVPVVTAPVVAVQVGAAPIVAVPAAAPLAAAVTRPKAIVPDAGHPRAAAAVPAPVMATAPSGLFDNVMRLLATPVIIGLAAVSIPASWWRRSPERPRR
jgi:hypothetical protein